MPKRSIQEWVETREGSYQQKTMAERQKYWETRVKPDRKLTPTVAERANEFDSTETPLPVEPEVTPSYQRTKRPKRKSHWLREHGVKVLIGVGVAAVISLASWALYQLYSLNREIGEIRVRGDGATQQQEQLRGDLQRFEERMQNEIDRMNDRLDRVPRSR